MMLGLEIYQSLYNRQDSLELLIGVLEEQEPSTHVYLRVVAHSNENESWCLVYGEAVVAPDGEEGISLNLGSVQVAVERLSLTDFIARIRHATESGSLTCGGLRIEAKKVFERWSFNRQPSLQSNFSRWPCLIAEGTIGDPVRTPLPLVARSNDHRMHYFRDIYDLIQEVTTFPKFNGPRDSRIRTLTIIIEDRRARISRSFREGNELVVGLEGQLPQELSVVGKITTNGCDPSRFQQDVAPEIRLPISSDPTFVEFAVTTKLGELVDIGGGHLSAIPPSFDDVDAGIGHAEHDEYVNNLLFAGECASCEFKPWVEPKLSSPKFKEIIRTVVAMANRAGGHIIIGVDDSGGVRLPDGKVLGKLRGQVVQSMGEGTSDDAIELETIRLYGVKVRDEIQKAVNPSVELRLLPVDLEAGKVLLVFVDQGSDRPYEIAETNEVLVRSNATNRRPTLEERRGLHPTPGEVVR